MSALSSLLVQDRILSVTQVEQVLQRQVILGGDLATNLLELGMVREEVLTEYIARVVRMPLLPLSKLDAVDPRILGALPWSVVNERRIVPVERNGNVLVVGASGLITVAVLKDISFLLGLEIEPRLVIEYRLAAALQRYYGIPMNGRSTALHRKLAPEYPVDGKPIVTQQMSASPAFAATPAPAVPSGIPGDPAEVDEDGIDAAWTKEEPSVGTVVVASQQPRPAREIDTTMKIVTYPRIETNAREPRGESTLDMPLPLVTPAPTPPPAVAPPDTVFPPPSTSPGSAAAGLISFSTAAKLLEKAEDRDAILSLLLAFASQAFEFTALFVVQESGAHGRLATFRGGAPFDIDTILLPLDKGGVFETVFRTAGYHLGPIGEAPRDREVLEALHRDPPRSCAIIPFFIRNRIVLLLYGDSGQKGVRANRIARIAEFGQLVSSAFESLLFRKKYELYAKTASQLPSPVAALAPAEAKGPARVEGAVAKVKDFGAFGAVRHVAPDEVAAAPSPPAEPAEPVGPAEPVIPASSTPSAAQSEPSPAVRVVMPASMPDPSLVSKVAVMTVRAPIASSLAAERASEHAKGATIPAVAVAPIAAVGKTPSRPPLPGAAQVRSLTYMSVEQQSAGEAIERPSMARTVRVEMREEIEHLISRVQERGPFDEAAARLLVEMGDDALAEMVKRFPGPLDCDRYQESSRLKRVGQHGPILRALLKFGPRAAQFVAPLMDSFDSEVRFYATFFFSEVAAPEALPGLVRRIFDVDRQIRVVAVDVIRSFENQPEFKWAVQEIAGILLSSNSSLEKKRLAADALGALRDPVAIRPLAEMLGSVDGILAERCQRALVKITFTDFGFSERRWTAWWEANASFHRIEWALAAVNHRVEEIRQNAIDELRRMVGNAIEWPKGPMDHRLRKEIKRRILLWWEREGRALNPVTAVERMV